MTSPAILIVDDEPALLQLLSRAVRKILPDAHVDSAATSAEAAIAIAGQPYSLLITDHFLDGATGSEIAKAAKARWPGLAVLLLSGASAEMMPTGCPSADLVMGKPFELRDLLHAIGHLVHPS